MYSSSLARGPKRSKSKSQGCDALRKILFHSCSPILTSGGRSVSFSPS
jgi:hypothetical protein